MHIVKIKHQNENKTYLYETPAPLKKDIEVVVHNSIGMNYGIVAEDSIEVARSAVDYIASNYYRLPLEKVIGVVTRIEVET